MANEKEKFGPNIKQQEAIDKLDGQVMLLAGPGTGKTYTVIKRIEKMLENGIKPSSILCLTFSDAAACEMRNRLIKSVGVLASDVDIYTYHSFCNDIIKAYPMQFNLTSGVQLISDTDKIEIMRKCIDETDLKVFVPKTANKYFYTGSFIQYVEKLKTKRLSKEEYYNFIETSPDLMPMYKEIESEIYTREQSGETRNKGRYQQLEKIKEKIEKAKELWTLYELYTQKMMNLNLIDFSDMINFVLDAFDNDTEFLETVSRKYSYFLVDEYQDTNELQNSIIFNLLDGNKDKNIFVVGDDDQIIYGFQGAKLDTIETFLDKYPDTTVICLEESNRSTQSILDFSYRVISQDENRLENNEKFKSKNINKRLKAVNQKIIPFDKKVRRLHFADSLQEINTIVDEIVALTKSDNCPINEKSEKDLSKIAIITKKRDELQVYSEILKGKNLPAQIDEGKNIFSIRSSILIYFYLKALDNYLQSSDKLFGLLLSEPFKIDLEDYNKILQEKRLYKKDVPNDFISIMQRLTGWKNQEKIDKFLTTFFDLKSYSDTNNLRNTIVEIVNRTGLLTYFYKNPSNRIENIDGIKKIIDEATDYQKHDSTRNLSNFVKYLDDCLNNEIDISTNKDSDVRNAIQLTTYHGSKGREFDVVYLPNLIAKKWENFSRNNEYKLICEEVLDKDEQQKKKDTELLKLLFVGITRAKHTLTISFAEYNDGTSQQMTKYLIGLSDYDFEKHDFETNAELSASEFMRNISRDVYENQNAFKNEIQERVSKIVLSPSRLNDYLTCPRKFFYTKVLGIDVEEADWDNANFGTVIHSLLEDAVRIAKQTGHYPTIEEQKEKFNQKIDNERFTSLEQKEKFIKQGISVLDNYYPHFIQLPIQNIEDIEFSFNGVKVGDYEISGKIDRIEKNNEGTFSLYDYKTGRPASASQFVVGGDKEGYYNQLCFYKYAFEKYSNQKVSNVGIIYVENHAKNVYKNLGEDDMQYIENRIKEVYKNINDLKFDPINDLDSGACKYCQYKNLCKLDLI